MSIKYSDSGFLDGADETKKLSFDVSGVTTGTTRTITMPDGDTKLYTGDGTSGQILTSNGAGVAPTFQTAAGGGKVLRVLQTVKTDTFSTTSTSLVDITSLSVTITPSSTSSKILVTANVSGSCSSGSGGAFALLRDSTQIGQADTAGSRRRSSFSGMLHTGDGSGDVNMTLVSSTEFLDSPSTTSSITYKIQGLTQGGTLWINRDENDPDSTDRSRTVSSITLMEIGA